VTACPDCDKARAGIWCGYANLCHGCIARAIARSQAAFNAIRKNDPDELRDAIARLFPNLPYKDARQLVFDWWQADHPQETTT
jgi:hypothetical protein